MNLNLDNNSVPVNADLYAALEGEPLKDPIEEREKFEQNHLGRFTASEKYKLMGGVVSTQEEWKEVLNSKRYLKDSLLETAEELRNLGHDIPVFKSKVNKPEIVEAIAKYIPIRHDWDDTAIGHIVQKARERVTGSESVDIEHLKHIEWAREHEVTGLMELKEAAHLSLIDNLGDDQVFHKFIHEGKVIGGATPDADSLNIIGMEIKCPNSKRHNEVRLGSDWRIEDGEWVRDREPLTSLNMKVLEPEWYWQIVDGFACTRFTEWYWGCYDPRQPEKKNQLHWLKFERQELKTDIDLCKKRTIQANALCEQMVGLLKEVVE